MVDAKPLAEVMQTQFDPQQKLCMPSVNCPPYWLGAPFASMH